MEIPRCGLALVSEIGKGVGWRRQWSAGTMLSSDGREDGTQKCRSAAIQHTCKDTHQERRVDLIFVP